MKYEFGLCGPFDFDEKATGGQSVKTKEFYFALSEIIGKDKIKILESTGYKKNPIKFVLQFFNLMKNCDNVVLFPARNGIKVFAPLCKIIKNVTHTKTYYSVIGGWISDLLDENPKLKEHLKYFDCILVETNVMKSDLEKSGLHNVEKLENFKRMKPISETSIKPISSPVKICYFSRVTKEKGIEDAVEAVKAINSDYIKCFFDIYGPVADGYDVEFERLRATFTPEIRYMGKIAPEDSVNTLREYDLHIFPTRYKTEGIPGSILDSYFAGVPVVFAKWNSYSDIMKDGITGRGYSMENVHELCGVLNELVQDEQTIMRMKKNCLQEVVNYLPDTVIRKFLRIVRG